MGAGLVIATFVGFGLQKQGSRDYLRGASEALTETPVTYSKSETPKPFSASEDQNATSTFLTEQQLAYRHQRSVKTIRNDRLRGGYVPFRKFGRHVRYRLSDVLIYEEAQLRKSTSDKGGDND
jgi:hypothetical protein